MNERINVLENCDEEYEPPSSEEESPSNMEGQRQEKLSTSKGTCNLDGIIRMDEFWGWTIFGRSKGISKLDSIIYISRY